MSEAPAGRRWVVSRRWTVEASSWSAALEAAAGDADAVEVVEELPGEVTVRATWTS